MLRQKVLTPALSTVLCFLFGLVLHAEERYEHNTLFQKGSWSVFLTYDTEDGDFWCVAETENRRAQSLNLVTYPNDQMTFFVFDESWNIAKRPVRFLVDIDYSRWTIDGTGDGIGVSLTMNEPDKAAKFVQELMEGNAVTILSADEHRLATFSLSGSFAAISNLMQCWDRISDDDPFTSSDPFTGTSDPF